VDAILAKDVYVVVGAVMLSSAFLVAGNLVADALLFATDPRIRMEHVS
jgi:peptide/nickel transport system permease protein